MNAASSTFGALWTPPEGCSRDARKAPVRPVGHASS